MKEKLRQDIERRRLEASRYVQQADELSAQGNEAAADELYSKAVRLAPSLAITGYGDPSTLLRRSEKSIDDLERYLKDESAKTWHQQVPVILICTKDQGRGPQKRYKYWRNFYLAYTQKQVGPVLGKSIQGQTRKKAQG